MNRKLPFNMKKVISVIVTLAFVISMFSCMSGVSVFAIGEHVHKVCVNSDIEDHTTYTEIEFQPLTQEDIETKYSNKLPSTAGKYYLTEDITLTAQSGIAADVTLCLNGHTVTLASTSTSAGRLALLKSGGTLSICDCSAEGTGTIKRNKKDFTGNSAILLTQTGSEFNLYSGTVDASEVIVKNNNGGAIAVGNKFNMYGGKIIGGTVNGDGTAKTPKGFGGAVYVTGTGTVNMYGGTITGGTAALGGNVYVVATSTATGGVFNMYGGSIENGTAVGKAKIYAGENGDVTYSDDAYGGNVYMTGGAKFNMTGGTVTGGTAKTINDLREANGGNFYVASGGTATKSTALNISAGTVSAGNASNGGNICVATSAYSEANISGGVVENGQAAKLVNNGEYPSGTTSTNGWGGQGGNIYACGKLNISGTAVIKDGIAQGGEGGGNIAVRSAVGYVKMTGGTVSGGTAGAASAASSIAVYNDDATTFEMTGGTVIGGSVRLKKGVISLSGTAKISEDGAQVYLMTGKELTVGELASGAAVAVAMQTSGVFAAGAAQYVDYFKSAQSGYAVAASGEDLVLEVAQHKHAIAVNTDPDAANNLTEAEKTEVVFEEWTSTDSLPTGTAYAGKYYYLANDVTVTGQQSFGYATLTEDIFYNICLNGHTVTYTGKTGDRAISLHHDKSKDGYTCTLNICDCSASKSGTITTTEIAKSSTGTVIWVRDSSDKLNLYSGTIDATNVQNKDGAYYQGAVLTNGVFRMYGGKIIGGTAATGAAVFVSSANNGTFNMYGGDLVGGTVLGTSAGSWHGFGGALYVTANTTANISGGTITGGVASSGAETAAGGLGGAIYSAGNLNISGNAEIIGGTALPASNKSYGMGGAVYLANGTATMTGGTITGGTAQVGAAVAVGYGSAVTFTMTGGTIKAGQAYNGGAVSLWTKATFNLEGGVVDGRTGAAQNLGGAVYAYSDNATVSTINLKSGTVYGTTAANGGAIALYGKENTTSGEYYRPVMNLSGASVIGGTAKMGGAVYNSIGTVHMTAGTIQDGIADDGGKQGGSAEVAATQASGGNVYVTENSEFNILGGTIKDGLAYGIGGNIYNRGVVTIANATVSGGEARRFYNASGSQEGGHGGNIYTGTTQGSVVYIQDGALIENGVANTGGNISETSVHSKVVMTGGTVKNGWGLSEGTGNINIFNAPAATFEMTGGTITTDAEAPEGYFGGGIRISKGTLKVSGAANISEILTSGKYTAGTRTIDITELDNSASVGIVIESNGYGAVAAMDADYLSQITVGTGVVKSYTGGYLVLNNQAAIDASTAAEEELSGLDTTGIKDYNKIIGIDLGDEATELLNSKLSGTTFEEIQKRANDVKKMLDIQIRKASDSDDGKARVVFFSSINNLNDYDAVAICFDNGTQQKTFSKINVYKTISDRGVAFDVAPENFSTISQWIYAVVMAIPNPELYGRQYTIWTEVTLAGTNTVVKGQQYTIQLDAESGAIFVIAE